MLVSFAYAIVPSIINYNNYYIIVGAYAETDISFI